MKYIKLLISIILVGSLFIVSCDETFEEMNKNPNEPTSVPSGLLTTNIMAYIGNYTYSTFWGGDMGSCWSQQWAKVNYEDEERYKVRQSVIEGYCWKGIYEDVIADAKSMEKLAIDEGNKVNQGVALVLQAYGFSILTEMFGDVPFTEAGQGEEGVITPKYDGQESIYDGLFAMLDQAESLIASGDGSINASTDLIYGGNATRWRKFANSLKFRLLMRISHKKDVSADLQAVAGRPLFSSMSDDAGIRYLSASPSANPMYESIVYGARFEYKINSVMVDMLDNLNDPRLPVYAQPNSNGEYRGKPAGIEEVPNDDYNYDNVSAIGELYLEPDFPGFLMTYSELMFLMAEAAHKGYISGGTAAATIYYNKGIEASFAFNGVSDGFAAYIAQNSIAYTEASGLQKIAEQNWIALFCQGQESWTEWRRTGYPVLSPAIDAVVSEIPSRLNYPTIEQSVNATSWAAAKAAMGGDDLTTKFWWLQ
ncbi:MAG: SusD/RagB family nutrient-binding outer membrane lipoprotein [Bacteroidales bacterium]|nr:SusD/RagB family nutrient-binding outer membrane lipoprotein [Bacteroidales bacterium]